MRRILGVTLGLFVWGAAIRAETPIPQDTARIEKRRAARLEWNRRTLEGAYDKVGKKDVRWDKPARKAMDLAARMLSSQVEPEITSAEIYASAKAAMDAGCDDPLVVFLRNTYAIGPNYPGNQEQARRMKANATALTASRYPAFRRAELTAALGRYALGPQTAGDGERKEAQGDFDASLALLAVSVASDEQNEFWEEWWYRTLSGLVGDYRRVGIEPEAAYRRVDAGLAKVPKLKVLRLKVRGQFWYSYGWEARGKTTAALVATDAAEQFEKRLTLAKDVLEEAERLRPDDPTIATVLIDLDKSIGGDRAAMERRFERAMKADGDAYGACSCKLDWLDPKWHGSDEDMLAFGRACRATNNWRAGIPLLCVEAHVRYAVKLGAKEEARYLGSPEVWSEIQSVFQEYLKRHPTDDSNRSYYATVAIFAAKYAEARALFQELGDRLSTWSHYPSLSLAQIKQGRDRVTHALTGKMADDDPRRAMKGWVRFGAQNNQGRWSVAVPTKPERRQEGGILGARASNVYTCSANGATYTVRIQPVPPPALANGPRAVLDAARDAIVAEQGGGKVRVERPSGLGGMRGLEFLIDSPKHAPAVVRVRVAVIGNRLYQLSILAKEADVSSPVADEFLGSFRLQQ